jgi:hypothetical protein
MNNSNQTKTNRSNRRSSKPRAQAPRLLDPPSMSTTRARGLVDPQQTTTNIVGSKRIRKVVALTSGVGALTLGDVLGCLPLTTPEIRVFKLSVWGNDVASLSCVFPVFSPPVPTPDRLQGIPGDNSSWVDEGTPGQQRAQIHLTPNFDFRNSWLSTAGNGNAAVLATFASSGTSGASQLIVDLSLQFRTTKQTCPALTFLEELLSGH